MQLEGVKNEDRRQDRKFDGTRKIKPKRIGEYGRGNGIGIVQIYQ